MSTFVNGPALQLTIWMQILRSCTFIPSRIRAKGAKIRHWAADTIKFVTAGLKQSGMKGFFALTTNANLLVSNQQVKLSDVNHANPARQPDSVDATDATCG